MRPAEQPSPDGRHLLAESAYRKLRAEILNGALHPGQVLRQEELAKRCNVSRVPLREALARLAGRGFADPTTATRICGRIAGGERHC